jgi:hypothetical protein
MASGFTAAQTGRTHDRTRPMLQQLRKVLPRRRRPHMTQRQKSEKDYSTAVGRPSTSVSKNLTLAFASRVGLTPSPTCQTWARWFPQGDAATSATKRVARMSALLGKPAEGFLCPSVNSMPERRGPLLDRKLSVLLWSTTRLTNLKLKSAASEPMELIELL